MQVSSGAIGQEPTKSGSAFQITVNTQGRFQDVPQFRRVIVRSTSDGRLVRVQDVARVELGAQDYVTNAYLDGQAAVALGIFQRPNTNALGSAASIIAKMEELKKSFRLESTMRSFTIPRSSSLSPSTPSMRRSRKQCCWLSW